MAYNPEFHEELNKLGNLHDSKNNDYATDSDPYQNLRECEKIGIKCPHCNKCFNLPAHIGVLVRMSDKYSRLIQLTWKEARNESVDDTHDDMAVYSILRKCLMKIKKEK